LRQADGLAELPGPESNRSPAPGPRRNGAARAGRRENLRLEQGEVPPLFLGREDLPLDCHDLGDDLLHSHLLHILWQLHLFGESGQGRFPIGVADKAGDVQLVACLTIWPRATASGRMTFTRSKGPSE
jgi:hypothetical protein